MLVCNVAECIKELGEYSPPQFLWFLCSLCNARSCLDRIFSLANAAVGTEEDADPKNLSFLVVWFYYMRTTEQLCFGGEASGIFVSTVKNTYTVELRAKQS